MLSMLLAYDSEGNVVATLDYMTISDEDGNVVGLVDFAEHEAAGTPLTDVWENSEAVGSATWPEWLGGAAHDFRVELEPGWSRSQPRGSRTPHRVRALVHRSSGHRRDRSAVEAAIARRLAETPDGEPADIRDIVGGPERALRLDGEGRTRPRVPHTRPNLPLVRRDQP